MKKLLISILIIVLVVFAVLLVAKDLILKTAVEQAVTVVTGFKTTLTSFSYQLPSTIQIKGLRIENPAEFEGRTFVEIPEIYASLSLSELLNQKRIHLSEVRLNIQEVYIEKNPQGVSNVSKLTAVANQTKKGPVKPAPSKPGMPFQLDRLELTVRHLTYNDRSNLLAQGGVPSKLSVDLRLEKEVLTNITKPEALVAIIVGRVLNAATLGRVLNIDVDQLVRNSLSDVTEIGKTVGQRAVNELGNAAIQATDLVNKTQVASTVTDATEKAKEQVSGLLGKIGSLVPAEEKK